MPINFDQLQLRRTRAGGQHRFALAILSLPAVLALAQQPAEVVPPSLPAEISKGSPALASPAAKGGPAASGPQLQTHPSSAAAANAQRAARDPDASSVADRQDSSDAVREPVAQPKEVKPSPRSSPAPPP